MAEVTTVTGMILSAAFVAKPGHIGEGYHADGQFQMGTVVVLVIHKAGLRHIYRLLALCPEPGPLIPGPSLYPHGLFVFQQRDPEDRQGHPHMVDRGQFRHPGAQGHPGPAAIDPSFHQAPSKPVRPDGGCHILLHLPRPQDRCGIGLFRRQLPGVLQAGSDRRLDGHDLHKEEKAYHRKEEDGHGGRRFQGDASS